MKSECEFCRIIAGKESARIVYRTADTTAFFPLRPASRGHTLVVPNRHVPDFFALTPPLDSTLTRSVLHVAKAVQTSLAPEGMNLITSSGEAASQSVFHLHIHVVPRWHGDPIGTIWPPSRQADQEMQDDIADLIREAAKSQRSEL